MSSKPKQTAQQKELERISIERERQLTVENARQTTKAFSDQIAFRKKLRGIFSLLSGGFKGYKLGSGGSLGSGASSGGGGGGAGSAGGTGNPGGGSGGRVLPGGGGGGGGLRIPTPPPGGAYR